MPTESSTSAKMTIPVLLGAETGGGGRVTLTLGLLRQKPVEAEPCSLWMVHRYTPQSTGDLHDGQAAGPSSPALQRDLPWRPPPWHSPGQTVS